MNHFWVIINLCLFILKEIAWNNCNVHHTTRSDANDKKEDSLSVMFPSPFLKKVHGKSGGIRGDPGLPWNTQYYIIQNWRRILLLRFWFLLHFWKKFRKEMKKQTKVYDHAEPVHAWSKNVYYFIENASNSISGKYMYYQRYEQWLKKA